MNEDHGHAPVICGNLLSRLANALAAVTVVVTSAGFCSVGPTEILRADLYVKQPQSYRGGYVQKHSIILLIDIGYRISIIMCCFFRHGCLCRQDILCLPRQDNSNSLCALEHDWLLRGKQPTKTIHAGNVSKNLWVLRHAGSGPPPLTAFLTFISRHYIL